MPKKFFSNKIKPSFLMVFGLTIILFFFFLRNSRMVFSQYIDTGQIIQILDDFFPKEEPENKLELVEVHTLNIPADFFEKGRSKYWLEVEYDPEKTGLVRGELGNYLESACITVRSWECHIDESGQPRVMPAPNGWIYFQELTNPAIYDGLNGATNLINPVVIKTDNWVGVEFKRILEYKSKNINTGQTKIMDEPIKFVSELTFCFSSIHYRIMEQGQALIKVYSKDDATNLYLNPVTTKIPQWVDYRAIVQRKDSTGNWRYQLVRKKPLNPGDDVMKGGDIIICEGGADWFKASIVDALNTDIYTFGKVNKINISGGRGPDGAMGTTNDGTITFYIAQPEENAKILRLNLPMKTMNNYQYQFARPSVIWHEATHTYHNWALANKSKAGIKDDDGDGLPLDVENLASVWGWQEDTSGGNGFKGELKKDSPYIRPKTNIGKSMAIVPSVQNSWDYFKGLIFNNIPQTEPTVGRGKVPNGYIDPSIATVTFYWPAGFSLSYQAKETLKSWEAEFGDNSVTLEINKGNDAINELITKEFLPKVDLIKIIYAIKTPHHPEEYDCEENARGNYVGK